MKINLENFTDVCEGPMQLNQLTRKIEHYILNKSPEKMVITIEKNKKIKKYYTTIYIPTKDFKKYKYEK